METWPVVHRAPWLLPISRPPIRDGGLVMLGGRILAVGPFAEIRSRYPGSPITEHPEAALLPGLVNAHIHLELSCLTTLSRRPAPASFPDWIRRLLSARSRFAADSAEPARAARALLAQQQAEGVVALADISNTGLTRGLASNFPGTLLCFKEYLGLRAAGLLVAIQALKADGQALCTGHAAYSTHIQLLRILKERANRLGHVFPIHVAESIEEHVMVRRGIGPMRDFSERIGAWDGTFQPLHDTPGGAVTYLHKHGLLDEHTLCVHCVQITPDELDLLAKTGAKVCLCPGSNRYLGVGRAPVLEYLGRGIGLCLGTDSIASNPKISLWREMRLLSQDHPALPPLEVLRMATLGGAEALGLADVLGSLEPGRSAALAVPLRQPAATAQEVAGQLIWRDSSDPIRCLDSPPDKALGQTAADDRAEPDTALEPIPIALSG